MNKMLLLVCAIMGSMLFLQCTPSPRFTSTPSEAPPTPERPKPAKEKGVPPKLQTNYRVGQSLIGVASYYGPQFHGKRTANGETFDMYGITAAHKTLPFNTVVRVTNLATNQSTLVRINDRGPFVPGRMIDLSYGAARKIGLVTDGTGRVRLEILEIGDNAYAR